MNPLAKFKDPVSGLTHLLGAVFGAGALLFLLVKCTEQASLSHYVSFVVFGISFIGLYLSSAAYHLFNVSEAATRVFRRIDHSMIFVLIAGSYTPFCVLALPGRLGMSLLLLVWVLTLAGIALSTFWITAPRWLSTSSYLLLGWLAMVAIYPLSQALTRAGFLWLVVGGLFYTVGAIIYWRKWPDPIPAFFGYHEIWHCFVLAGSVSHFLSVATLVI